MQLVRIARSLLKELAKLPHLLRLQPYRLPQLVVCQRGTPHRLGVRFVGAITVLTIVPVLLRLLRCGFLTCLQLWLLQCGVRLVVAVVFGSLSLPLGRRCDRDQGQSFLTVVDGGAAQRRHPAFTESRTKVTIPAFGAFLKAPVCPSAKHRNEVHSQQN